jgi:hypothetical protein
MLILCCKKERKILRRATLKMMLEFDLCMHVGVIAPLFLSARARARERDHQSESQSRVLIEMLLAMMGSRNSRSIDTRTRDDESQLDVLVLLPSVES